MDSPRFRVSQKNTSTTRKRVCSAASVMLCWFAIAGCSVESDTQTSLTPGRSLAPSQQSGAVANTADEVEDGYSHPRIDERRKAVYPYFKRLENSRDAEEEREAVEAMAAWAKNPQDGEDSYKFLVTKGTAWLSSRDLSELAAKDQSVTLDISCPCFPPVTPRMAYQFKDPSNLKHFVGILWEPETAMPGR